MAMITPNSRFMTRLVPAIAAEAVVLVVAVLLFVYTGQIFWIFIAAAVGVVFAIWILILLSRHRDEWRYTNNDGP
jgi:L-asparagine transporter-like permease